MKRHFLFVALIVVIVSVFLQPYHYKTSVVNRKHLLNVTTAEITGKVISNHTLKSYFIFDPQSISQKKMKVFYKSYPELGEQIQNGEYHLTITLDASKNAILGYKNEVGFDMDMYFFSNGISGQYHLETFKILNPPTFCLHCEILDLKHKIKNQIELCYDKNASDFLLALLLGSREAFEDYSLYKDYGLAHLFAISGLHFGLLYMFMKRFFPFTNQYLKSIVILLVLVFMYLWVGGGYSAQRAFIIIAYFEISNLMMRKPDALMAIGVSVIIVLFIQPYAILSSAFQLSYYAFFIIAIVLRKFKSNFIMQAFIVQLLLIPASLYHFQTINIFSFMLNALLIPLMGFILPFGIFEVLLIVFDFSKLRLLIVPIMQWILNAFRLVVTFFPQNTIRLEFFRPFDYYWAWIFIGIWCILSCFYLKRKRLFDIIVSFTMVVVLLSEVYMGFKPDFEIRFTDVGHGDMSLVRIGKTHILIDTGSQYFDAPSYLNALGVYDIDLLIVTHAHNDHYGNLEKIVSQFNIKTLYTTQETADLFVSLDQSTIKILKEPVFIELEGVFVDLLPVFSTVETNDNAILAAIRYKDISGFYTADVSGNIIDTIKLKTDITFVKVSHHGSKTGYSPQFYQVNAAKYGIISCSNKYSLPNVEIIDLLEENNITHKTTFEKGEIILNSNIEIKSYLK